MTNKVPPVKTILLVEDNADDEALILHALKLKDIRTRIVVARDGVQALDYLLNPKNVQPSLVLLDLKMPKMDGHEVLRRLREYEATRLVPVVVFTSSSEPGDVNRSYKLGASSYVRKPIDYTGLATAVNLLAEYWLNVNQPPALDERTATASPKPAGGLR